MEEELEKEFRGMTWEKDKKGFEQHMLEEDVVRMDWAAGKFEKESMQREPCGDKNARDKMHKCCEEQCKGMMNASQHSLLQRGAISVLPRWTQ